MHACTRLASCHDYCHSPYLGEVELQRVVGGERHHEPPGEKLWQWVTMVVEEERVVAEWRHGDADLCQVEEVLQHGRLQHTHQCLFTAIAPHLYLITIFHGLVQ